jgi:hypothetical protein
MTAFRLSMPNGLVMRNAGSGGVPVKKRSGKAVMKITGTEMVSRIDERSRVVNRAIERARDFGGIEAFERTEKERDQRAPSRHDKAPVLAKGHHRRSRTWIL